MYCRICGDEGDKAGVEYRPSARQALCRSCAKDTPAKVGRSEFEAAYWVTADGLPAIDDTPAAIRREFYEDYLASNLSLAQYIERTTTYSA